MTQIFESNSAESKGSRAFGPWATLLWTAGAALVWVLGQVIALILWVGVGRAGALGPEELEGLGSDGGFLALTALVCTPPTIALLFFAVRQKRADLTDYFALRRPSWRHLGLGLAIMALLLPLTDLMTAASGREIVPPFMVDTYRSARAAGMLPLYTLALIAIAPVGEELIFRGFLFRGFAQAWGAAAAILVTAVAWAALHVQYEFFIIVQIVVMGLVLGWLRWKSASTLLTIVLHAIVNSVAFVQVALRAAG